MGEVTSLTPSSPKTSTSISVRRPESFVLAWFVEETGDDTYKAVTQLRRTVNEVHVFSVLADCLEYIKSVHDERVILVFPNLDSCKDILPVIDDLPQVDSIYMLNTTDGRGHTYRKLKKNKYTSTIDLSEKIRSDCAKAERQLLAFDVLEKSQTGDMKSEEQDKQEASFMYGLLLKETVLKMDDGDEHELIEFCRPHYRDNDPVLSVMDTFKHSYSNYSPVSWYTRDSFVFRMLNKGLRDQHVETIYAFRFFIRQLHTKLTAMSNTEGVQLLYRGVRLPNDRFEQIRSKLGGLLSFSNFLSTSANEHIARAFAGEAQDDLTETAMLMIIKLNKPIPTDAVVADITSESYFGSAEDEWLFSLGTVFRIDSIEKEDNNAGVWAVHLTLTNGQDVQLKALTEHFRAVIRDVRPLVELGRLVYEMGEIKSAETFYKKALESETEWEGRSLILSNLGAIYDEFDDFDQALACYQQSLDIEKEHRPEGHAAFGPTYNNIGIIWWKKNNFKEALSFIQLAIDSELSAREPNQEMLANNYNNLGTVLFSLGRYEQSLSAKLEAHDIKAKTLPAVHPSIALSYQNIAKSLYDLSHVRDAVNYMQMAVDIDLRSLPSGHLQTTDHQKSLAKYTQKLNEETS